ncbi:MAG: 5-formyltetrahydrofolate cyclo-ligase [Cyclobacteriaceae bacterium]|nr:5-formyltetrahydrofolate cyclo-ligase [Cyclobacteriaceae bacterium]
MKKEELRKIYLAKRKALSESERLNLSRDLCDLFFSSIDLSFIKVIHIYLPIESKQEPDTWLIIDRIRREFPHILLSIPIIQANKIESIYFEGLHQLEKNSWGILEPKQGVPTPIENIDLVIVPLLAFDKSGHRVGYGHGFYDRFLKDCRSDCKKIGLSFFLPEEKIEDSNQFDTPLHIAFTPIKAYSF